MARRTCQSERLSRLGLPKLTFQVIRRTIATLAKDKGHVKDIQGTMRHSRLATTTEVYMQSHESGVRSTVNSIQDELCGAGARGTGQSHPEEFRPATGKRTALGRSKTEEHCRRIRRALQLEKQRLQSPSAEWFWNLRQECDKVVEGR